MKTNGRFTLNLEAMLLEKDENSFVKDLLSLRQVGYFFPHYYNDENDTISSFGGLIVTTKRKDIIERIKYVQGIYKIEPTQVLLYEGEYHIIFELDKGIDSNVYKRYQKALEFIYTAKAKDFHFYLDKGGQYVNEVYSGSITQEEVVTVLSNIYAVTQDKKIERELDKHNLEEYNKSNKLSFQEIANILQDTECLKYIDEEKGIHINCGNKFDYVVDFLQSRADTFIFFNDNFDLDFIDNESKLSVSKEGVSITDGGGFYSNSRGYYILDKEGKDMQITDFYIKVHYRLIKSDKEKVFIVSLHNEVGDERTEKIEWVNITSKGPFADFLQKLGNFHFTGMNQSFIASLHKKICQANVPDVKFIIGYGFHKDEGIVLFKNGIFDIKEKIFTPIDEGDKYYFNYNGKGYYPSDKMGNSLSETIGSFVPNMGDRTLVEFYDTISFMKSIYSDNSGVLLLMFVLGVMGNGLYSDKKGEFPIFFIRGLTGSGKSKYSEILQYIFGTGKPSEFSSSSSFTMTMLFTYLKAFPYFITEFRENSKDKDNKISILRSNYDGSGQTKGRPDQTVVNYNYSAIPIIDGQEMITDPALRTRSLQIQFLSKHKIKGNFDSIFKGGKNILKGIVYTYLNLSDGSKYDEYRNDGYELFKSHSDRIRQNMAAIYAGCMAFCPTKKDMYIDILNESLTFQNTDYRENGDDMQIIKAITKFLESDRDNFDAIWDISPTQDEPKGCIIISWSKLEEYIKARRIELSLKVDTYKSSLENIGYHIGNRDDPAEDRMRNGIIIPYDNIPSEFLVHSIFYNVHKVMKRQLQQSTINI